MVGIYKKLSAWKESKKIAIKIFTLTKDFPKEEIFGITAQIHRAVVSISSNIAEAYGTRYIKKRINQLDIAIGSTNEVENLVDLSYEFGYINKDDFDDLNDLTESIRKQLYGLIKSLEEGIVVENNIEGIEIR
jgi:four helix bundle protein